MGGDTVTRTYKGSFAKWIAIAEALGYKVKTLPSRINVIYNKDKDFAMKWIKFLIDGKDDPWTKETAEVEEEVK